ncbi:MAG: helix-turn-helix transcriptional regulator [Sandaracinaceae bacterium]|nr:helix-turn-helix transcriptional regulator [Sandaracinaceae bacterium]
MRDRSATIGARIREVRRNAKLTLEALAERAGIDPTYLGGLERGQHNPTVATLQRLAKALGVDAPAMLDDLGSLSRLALEKRLTARVKVLNDADLRRAIGLLDALR